jgi:hypothetical protein
VPGQIRNLQDNSALITGVKEAFMNHGSPWTMYRTRFLVRARQLTEPLVFTDALGREQSGRPGDYLVESSEGVRRITAKILFEDIYVPLATAVDETEGARSTFSRAVSQASTEQRSSNLA